MDFISYEDVASRGAMFKYVIENDLMPPWYVDPNTGPWKDDISLTLKEKAMLLKWIEADFPRRVREKNLLWEKRKIDESKMSADYVISLPEKVLIPAEGFTSYKRFIIQTNFKEDKWIKNVKYILKPKVIHHFVIHFMDSSYDTSGILSGDFNYISEAINFLGNTDRNTQEYNVQILHKNAGVKLPRNAKLILEVHYESIGREILDDYSQVHINFHRKKPKYEVITLWYDSNDIKISPHKSNHKIQKSYKVKEKKLLVQLGTHMHLRGKASSIFVTDPKDVRKRIFGISPFVMGFEKVYTLAKPLAVSEGSTLECVNWFDNSEKNPLNPAPEKYVKWGLFLEDEMSTCVLRWLIPTGKHSKHFLWEWG